jgi:hypothetical protein
MKAASCQCGPCCKRGSGWLCRGKQRLQLWHPTSEALSSCRCTANIYSFHPVVSSFLPCGSTQPAHSRISSLSPSLSHVALHSVKIACSRTHAHARAVQNPSHTTPTSGPLQAAETPMLLRLLWKRPKQATARQAGSLCDQREKKHNHGGLRR